MVEKRTVHCWMGKSAHIAETQGYNEAWAEAWNNDATCMLEHGHEGDHDWVSDKDISVSLPEPLS
jgi:hypothetical protein